MLQVGDVIKRVDLQDTAGMQPGQVHQLLQGLPGSTVSVKYQRPPSNLDMRCELPCCKTRSSCHVMLRCGARGITTTDVIILLVQSLGNSCDYFKQNAYLFWRSLFFPGTLIRETGTEHVLKEHHGGWKTHDLTDNRARGDEARRKAENINHGYVKINETAVRHKEEKFTAAELAEHFERRKAEDEANIKAADELVARLQVCVNKRQ
jgi:hypothetical protein